MEDNSIIEIKGIEASIQADGSSDTRAAYDPTKDQEYVGRPVFVGNDEMVFTKIARTSAPLTDFSYKEISYKNENTESGGWKLTGNTVAKIYWSDALSPHTFIGYSKPQQAEGKSFLWSIVNVGTTDSPVNWYYGSLGTVSETGTLDYSGVEEGKAKLKQDDILLTHSTTMQAEPGGSIAKVHYYHGLANLRIVVNLNGFSTSSNSESADNKVKVYDMIVKDMPMLYKWTQTDAKTQPLNSQDDNSRIETVYGSGIDINKKRDIKTWTHKPEGESTNQNKKFIFHTLAVPTTDAGQNLSFDFTVSYPDPLNPSDSNKDKTPKYRATVNSVKLYAGKCTTVTINLNHESESMTVGAVYEDWEYVETPDQGELKKNKTFLASTDRNTVTIIGDEKATVDDATWLYYAGKGSENKDIIKDIYGNDGSKAHPFQISTAAQLLSFAYEVKGTNRRSSENGNESSITGGFDFTGYYVALDAGLTLQASANKTTLEGGGETPIKWIGIGEATVGETAGKPFNGNFSGGVRLISRLYGKPFFMELGPQAHVGQLILEDVVGINGEGGFAEINKGVICACKVDGDVTSESTNKPVGSLVGTNSGLIFACYHIGDLTANSAEVVGGLVGENTGGKIVASYNMGKITTPVEDGQTAAWKYGILGKGSAESVYGCFYDHTKASNVSKAAPDVTTSTSFPSGSKKASEIIQKSFVGDKESTDAGCLNGIINSWVETNRTAIENAQGTEWADHFKAHYYVAQPASYPYII